MEKAIIERCWKRGCLKDHETIRPVYDTIKSDIAKGIVFPALRENEIHLYHEGGRAFRIRPLSVKTHRQYKFGCGKGEVSLPVLTPERYADIKKRCKEHNCERLSTTGERQEGWIVARLFRRFSYWSRYAEREQPKLIDVEVRFRGKDKPEKIDLLFLEDDGRLRFVEVKRQYDPRIRSSGSDPEVVCQIRGYQDVLKDGRNHITHVYAADVPKVLAKALELEPFSEPTAVCPRVPILVCRRDAKEGRDTWLRDELRTCQNDEIGDHLVVDGGSVETGSYWTGHPSWCPDGRWERLNLREVFRKIDERSG